MAQLEDKDIKILDYYADKGMRERYWNYINYVEKRELGQNYEGYGLLALSVVRNDAMPGKIANNYAQNYVAEHPLNGKSLLGERQWERVGIDLMKEDYAIRAALVKSGQHEQALNLPVEHVYAAHANAFKTNGIDHRAWTPAVLIEASYQRTGNFNESNQIWKEMLNSENLGVDRAVNSLKRQGANDELVSMYTVNQTRAYKEALTDVPYTDLDTIRTTERSRIGQSENHYYQKIGSVWFEGHIANGFVPYGTPVLNSEKIQHLDALSAFRNERNHLSDRNKRADGDPNLEITSSKQTIADNRGYGQEHRLTDNQPIPKLDLQLNPRRERFEQLFAAVMSDDVVATRQIQTIIMNSDMGQQFIEQAKTTVAEQDKQLQEQQAQLAQQAEIDAPVRRGPVMRM
jgi:hypothetical protein